MPKGYFSRFCHRYMIKMVHLCWLNSCVCGLITRQWQSVLEYSFYTLIVSVHIVKMMHHFKISQLSIFMIWFVCLPYFGCFQFALAGLFHLYLHIYFQTWDFSHEVILFMKSDLQAYPPKNVFCCSFPCRLIYLFLLNTTFSTYIGLKGFRHYRLTGCTRP